MIAGIFSRTYVAKGEAVFAAIKKDGFACAQLNLSSLGLESLPEIMPTAAQLHVARHGIEVIGLSGTYNMAHPDPAYRLAQRKKFAHVVGAAKLMGIGVVSLCTGSRDADNMWAHHPDNHSTEALRDFRSELDAALALAEGLMLAIEPEPGNVVRNAKVARAVLDEVKAPNLKVILDAANLLEPQTFQRQREIMSEAFDLFGADVVQAHAKDVNAKGRVVAPGQGVVDLEYFIQGLHRANFQGPVVAHGFEERDAAEAGKNLMGLLRSISELLHGRT